MLLALVKPVPLGGYSSREPVIKIFRGMSIAAIALIAVSLLLALFPGFDVLQQSPVLDTVLGLIGAVGAACALLPWPAAVWHWRRRYPPHPHWIRWGVIVLFGLAPGAWAYWILASRHYEAADAAAAVIAETFVRLVRLRESLKPVPIYASSGEPIDVEWLAISAVPEYERGPESYCLYFLDGEGNPSECLQFETLRIALDQARAIVGVEHSEWRECSVTDRGEGSDSVDIPALLDAVRA